VDRSTTFKPAIYNTSYSDNCVLLLYFLHLHVLQVRHTQFTPTHAQTDRQKEEVKQDDSGTDTVHCVGDVGASGNVTIITVHFYNRKCHAFSQQKIDGLTVTCPITTGKTALLQQQRCTANELSCSQSN